MGVKKRPQKKAGAARAPGAAPALSDEPRPKGSTRRLLEPPGRHVERPKLSSEAPEEAAPAARSRQPSRRMARSSEPRVAGSARTVLHAPAEAAGAPRTLRHTFHLRPGLLVALELPEDVTPAEIRRFCNFLEALPFGAGDSA